MAKETGPPGKTFEERWPDDAATANYLAGPWVPVAAGSLAGLIGLPILLGRALLANPVSFIVIVGGIVLVTTLEILRTTDRTPGRARAFWKIALWILLAAGAGVLLDGLSVALCDSACAAAGGPFDGARLGPNLISFAVLFGGSIGLAILVNRAGDRFVRRTRRAPDSVSPSPR